MMHREMSAYLPNRQGNTIDSARGAADASDFSTKAPLFRSRERQPRVFFQDDGHPQSRATGASAPGYYLGKTRREIFSALDSAAAPSQHLTAPHRLLLFDAYRVISSIGRAADS
jgi:hypothetical protein